MPGQKDKKWARNGSDSEEEEEGRTNMFKRRTDQGRGGKTGTLGNIANKPILDPSGKSELNKAKAGSSSKVHSSSTRDPNSQPKKSSLRIMLHHKPQPHTRPKERAWPVVVVRTLRRKYKA